MRATAATATSTEGRSTRPRLVWCWHGSWAAGADPERAVEARRRGAGRTVARPIRFGGGLGPEQRACRAASGLRVEARRHGGRRVVAALDRTLRTLRQRSPAWRLACVFGLGGVARARSARFAAL